MIEVLLTQGVVLGAFCAYLATQKNRDAGTWFVLGFLFSVFALIAIAASSKPDSGESSTIAAGGAPSNRRIACMVENVAEDWSRVLN